MRLQKSYCNVSKVVPYTDSTRNSLKQHFNDESSTREICNNTSGGVLSDINYTWLCNGPRLEIISTKNGAKIAAWTFGEVVKDYYTQITCVVSLPTVNSQNPVLVVGLQSGGTKGMICIFDIRTSRVLRAIQIDKPVSSIHVIDGGNESSLPGVLRALDGILAVGTEEGRIYLIDLCRQSCEDAINSTNQRHLRDEISPCDIIQISLNDIPMLEKHKEMTLKTGDHLCIQLNEFCTDKDFILRGPKGEIRLRANIVEVKISAMHYCHQLGSLLVGYNFGAFQLYNLLSIKLEYSSPAYADCIPVSHFAFQEPCDDPRAFCYVWVMYSNIEKNIPGFPLSVMYSLSYATKEHLEGYGCLYQELGNCSIRFQTELKSLPTSNLQKPIGATCVSLNAYTKGIQKLHGSFSQEVLEDHLALCCVVWTVFNNQENETFMCLFDLNQWYKEQMPASPNYEDNSSYMVFASLTEIFTATNNVKSVLFDVKIDPKSITQFVSAQRLEEHYFPSALSFKLICPREEDIIWIDSIGVQRHLLNLIKIAGPLCLLRPTDIFQQCISLGLTPINSDISYNTNTSLKLQREMILSVALEHQLISWLCQCAQDWSNGAQSIGGCTLDFLLSWTWQRTNSLKNTVNELCSPLFDYSGLRLDSNALELLNDCAKQLRHLSTLYEFVLNNCAQFLVSRDEIGVQYSALKMICVYIEVLQWLLNVGLLPECPMHMYPRPDGNERLSAPYPVESLIRFYKSRRRELFELQGIENVSESQSCDLLFIDNLIDIECGGETLHLDWKNDGGCGLYPPPSLQALLRTYLIEDVDIVFKHCIFIYVFLDLAMSLDQSGYTPIITHLIKFPAVFKLSPSIIKITQAFWQLDHGDFSTAMAQLLDPLVSNEVIQPWQHRIAVKALLAQGQHQHALLYHQVRQPPMTNVQDLLIAITVLIVNDLLKEAFHFQRQNRSEYNEKEILNHFMEACDKTNKIFQVIELPLNEEEEIALVKYLQENRREETDNYLVQYFLQRSRFAEAFENNDKLNGKLFKKQGLVGQVELNSRNSMVERFKSTLPAVTQDVLKHYNKQNIEHSICQIVDRPDPMSVFVHTSQDKLKYKSSLIQASFQKAKETWSEINKNSIDIPFISTPKKLSDKSHSTPVIFSTLVQSVCVQDDLENEGPSSNKRQKLSPRQPIGSDKRKGIVSAKSLLLKLTPLVKRKTFRGKKVTAAALLDNCPGSPQSILKVRKLVQKSSSPNDRGNSTTPELIENNSDNNQPFDDLTKETAKNSLIDLSNYEIATPKSKLIVTSRKSLRTPKTPSVRFEDSRPSTPSSEGSVENMEVDVQIETPKERIIPIELEKEKTPVLSSRKRKLNDSVQSRRSYKEDGLNNTTAILESIDAELKTPKESPKTQFPKVSGRKSLTRKVLEQNTIAKVLSSPRRQTRSNKSNSETVGVEITHTEKIKTVVKEVSVNKTEETSKSNVLESKNVFSTETEPGTSSQIIKHTHNESLTKSSTKLTEFLDDSGSDSSIDPILAQGSDVDESFLIKYVKDKSTNNYSTLSESMSKNLDFESTQDMIQDILPEENEDIIEIQSIDNDDDTENKDEEIIEENQDDGKENNVVVIEPQPFEITDDLTDEDVSFTIHNTMDVQIDSNKNENIMEMKDMEPENYIEPNFEEEVRNVLTEETADEQNINIENKDKISVSSKQSLSSESESNSEKQEDDQNSNKDEEIKICYEENETEKHSKEKSDEESNSDEDELNKTISSSSEEEETSNDVDSSDEEKDFDQKSDDNVIKIDSSTEEEMSLRVESCDENEDSTSVDVFEKNITTTNLTLESTDVSLNNSKSLNEARIEESVMETEEVISNEEIQTNEPTIKEVIIETQESTIPVVISEKVELKDEKINEPSTSKEEERPKRNTRASSVTPISSNEIFRKTRARSVDLDIKTPTRLTRSRRLSTQTEEQNLEVIKENDKVLDTSHQQINDEQTKVERVEQINIADEKIPAKRGRKPSVQKDDKKIDAQTNEPTLQEDKPTLQEELITSESKQKIDTPQNKEKTTEESILTGSKEEKTELPAKKTRKGTETELISIQLQEKTKDEKLPTEQKEIDEKLPSRRGRRPSTQKEIEPVTDVEKVSTRGRKVSESENQVEDQVSTPSRRGRKANVEVEEEVSTRRGRKVSQSQDDDVPVVSTPSRRGRKASVEVEEQEVIKKGRKISESGSQIDDVPLVTTPSRRGRKASVEVEEKEVNKKGRKISESGSKVDDVPLVSTPSRRGRKASVEVEEKEVGTPVRRSRRTSLQAEVILEEVENVASPVRRSTRRTSVQSEQEEPKLTTPSRRPRRLSTQSEDHNLTLTPRRGRRSSLTASDTPLTPSRTTRASSVVSVDRSPAKSVSEKIDEYAATHRLTRRQKAMVEEMMMKGLPLGSIDPVALMDKESFSGEPDLEEQHHKHSPSSSIYSESSVGTRSSARLSKRNTPDTFINSPSLPSTPKHSRVTRGSVRQLDSPTNQTEQTIDEDEPSTSSGRVKRKSIKSISPKVKRSRRMSEESLASETGSIQSELAVKLNRLEETDIERLRHRSLSPSILKQDIEIDSPRPGKIKRKGRTSILAKTELSKISEENTSVEPENVSKNETQVSTRRGRSKKT